MKRMDQTLSILNVLVSESFDQTTLLAYNIEICLNLRFQKSTINTIFFVQQL